MPPKKMKLSTEEASSTSVVFDVSSEIEYETTNEKLDKNATSDLDRERILKAYLAGKSIRDIALILDINRRRVEMIIRKYVKTGKVKCDSTQPSPSVTATKLNSEQIMMLKMWVMADASLSGVQLAEKVMTNFGIRMSPGAVYKYLGDFFYSIKRVSPQLEEIENDSRTIELRKDFAQIFAEISSSYAVDLELVFVGQMRFRLYTRDRDSKGKLRCRNMSICVAFNELGVIDFIGQNLPITRDQFEQFLVDVMDSLKTNDGVTSGVIIMDEGDFKNELDRITDVISEQDFAAIYLPPNSPFLNPAECLFSEWRELLDRVGPSNELEVVNTIEQGKKIISSEDCQRYFHTIRAFLQKCLDGEEIDPNQSVSSIVIQEEESEEKDTIIVQHY